MTDPEQVPDLIDMEPQEAIAIHGEVPLAELAGFFEQAFGEAARLAAASGVRIVGPPFAFYPGMPTATVTVQAGFPVSATPAVGTAGAAHRLVLPGGRVARMLHVGPYDSMEATYGTLRSWMLERGLEPSTGMWECYLSDPQAEPDPRTWRTVVMWPVNGGASDG